MHLIPQAQQILDLVEKRKNRERFGLFVVEGEKAISENINRFKYLLYSKKSETVDNANTLGIPTYNVSHNVMAKLSQVETPQGIIGVSTWLNFAMTL